MQGSTPIFEILSPTPEVTSISIFNTRIIEVDSQKFHKVIMKIKIYNTVNVILYFTPVTYEQPTHL